MPNPDVLILSVEHLDALLRRTETILSARGLEIQVDMLRSAVAKLLGREQWSDFFDDSGNLRRYAVELDESIEVSSLTLSLRRQADVLEKEIGLSAADASEVAAELRATAHPYGPHSLNGKSSVSGDRGKLEYRGIHPEKGPLVYENGTMEAIKHRWGGQISMRNWIVDQLNKEEASRDVWPSVNDRLVMFEPDDLFRLRDLILDEGETAIRGALLRYKDGRPAGVSVKGPLFRPHLEFAANT